MLRREGSASAARASLHTQRTVHFVVSESDVICKRRGIMHCEKPLFDRLAPNGKAAMPRRLPLLCTTCTTFGAGFAQAAFPFEQPVLSRILAHKDYTSRATSTHEQLLQVTNRIIRVALDTNL